MSVQNSRPRFKVGDRVRLRFKPSLVGMISEVSHFIAGSGRIRYRIRIPMDPEPLWMELPESEVEEVADATVPSSNLNGEVKSN